tara:strand:+ start:1506 stop:1925 length:420 start_codon:yes stop_codon:yes gene_type:complete
LKEIVVYEELVEFGQGVHQVFFHDKLAYIFVEHTRTVYIEAIVITVIIRFTVAMNDMTLVFVNERVEFDYVFFHDTAVYLIHIEVLDLNIVSFTECVLVEVGFCDKLQIVVLVSGYVQNVLTVCAVVQQLPVGFGQTKV